MTRANAEFNAHLASKFLIPSRPSRRITGATPHPKLYGLPECYYCKADRHHDCHSHECICCGEKNKTHYEAAQRLAAVIRVEIHKKRAARETA